MLIIDRSCELAVSRHRTASLTLTLIILQEPRGVPQVMSVYPQLSSNSALWKVSCYQLSFLWSQHQATTSTFTMSSGTSGSDEKISGAKIDPLASETKYNTPLDTSSRGATGTDKSIDHWCRLVGMVNYFPRGTLLLSSTLSFPRLPALACLPPTYPTPHRSSFAPVIPHSLSHRLAPPCVFPHQSLSLAFSN